MPMMRWVFGCFLVLATQGVFAEAMAGVLVGGGGVDDMSLRFRMSDGKRVDAYCTTAACKQLVFAEDGDDVSTLERRFLNKRVKVTISKRRNKGQVAGPGDDEILSFVTQLRFVD